MKVARDASTLALLAAAAVVAVAVIIKRATASGPDVVALPPDPPAPPEDWIVGRWIEPAVAQLVDVPYADIPFFAKREIRVVVGVRNRGNLPVSFRPEVRQSYGGEYFNPDSGTTSNVALPLVDIPPGAERIIQGTIPFEGPSTLGGQTVYATLHGRVTAAGSAWSKDRDLSTVVYFSS